MQRCGICFKPNSIRVIDGDTIEVSITRTVTIRISSPNGYFDTPEMDTGAGHVAKAKLEGILSSSDDVVVFVPSDSDAKLTDIFSFDRAIGEVYVDGKDVTEAMLSDEV